MKRIVISLALILPLVLACGRSRDEAPAPSVAQDGAAGQRFASGERGFTPGSPDAKNSGGQPQPAPDIVAAQVPQERLQVKNAEMTLQVNEIKKAETAIQEAVKLSGGYLAYSQIIEASGTFTCKVPQAGFDEFLSKIETIGVVKNKVIRAEDVTSQFFDLENRITNRRILLDRYRSYLARAVNTDELINIERTINNLMTEIDSLEGSMKNLSNQIDYSTLTLTIQLPPGEGAVFSMPSFAGGLRGVGEFFLIFLHYLLIVSLYILAIGVPLLLLAGIVYFVGFGRVGLILKFFRFLGPKAK